MTADATNVSEHIRGICDLLGLTYNLVSRLDVRPAEIEAEWYVPNEHGSAHIDPKTGEAVMDRQTFKVIT